ncbi:MAG: PQQ-binding-like beta-propeller repeat protein [Candidatus Thorarchaeota archaeon]
MTTTSTDVLWSYTQTGRGSYFSTPAIADIDGDGDYDIVVGSYNNRTYALDGSTGTLLWSFTTGGPVECSPSVADIDGDGDFDLEGSPIANSRHILPVSCCIWCLFECHITS